MWLFLFKAETPEDLEKIKALEVPEMNEAISAYNKITVSPEFREMERQRSLARHDEATALYYAQEKGIGIGREEGKVETARNLKLLGASMDLIIKSTGLSQEQIAKL